MILWFVHGWGFDSALWSALATRLAGHRAVLADLGYFGAEALAPPTAPFIAVAHSFGTMRVLRDAPLACSGLIALNGFDGFVARAGRPGVAPRVLDRMIARFEEAPRAALADFRARCGTDAPFPAPDIKRLSRDLLALRDMDCAPDAARWSMPILSLQGGHDPILPAPMREAVFAATAHVERATHPAAGHLLPVTEPEWCASQIAGFVERCHER